MRPIASLCLAALLAGCPVGSEPSAWIEGGADEAGGPEHGEPEESEPEATEESLDAVMARLAALEVRLEAAETAAANNTWNVDNAELWLHSLTGDVVALEAHTAAQDAILVSTAARVDEVEVAVEDLSLRVDGLE